MLRQPMKTQPEITQGETVSHQHTATEVETPQQIATQEQVVTGSV